MKIIKRLIIVIMVMVVILVPLNADAASLVQVRIPGTYVNSLGLTAVYSTVKNVSGTRRYTTNHLYEYTRDGGYVTKSSVELALNNGVQCSTELVFSSLCKYMCRCSVYNSASPSSGYADQGYAYYLWY